MDVMSECNTHVQPGTIEYGDAVNNLIDTALGVAGVLLDLGGPQDDYVENCVYGMLHKALFNAVMPFAKGPLFDRESFS